MEIQTLLNQYEKAVESAMSINPGAMQDKRLGKCLTIFTFLRKCGIDTDTLEAINTKYNF